MAIFSSGIKNPAGRSFLRIFFFLILLGLPLALAVLPLSFFEAAPSLCLVKHFLHLPCPGCGMTRALACIFHGNFLEAFHYNPLVGIVFPLLSFIWLKTILREWREIRLGVNASGEEV
jgi:hypothetical protein